jgi:hypothetical protein
MLLVCSGCARAAPAGFWKNFRSKLIVASHSDQGPWGGTRWIHWTAPEGARLPFEDVSEFARKNGWKCDKPQSVSAALLRRWVDDGKPVFPAELFDAAPEVPINFEKPEWSRTSGGFPRHLTEDSQILRCDSRWIRTLGPSGRDETAYGFILVERSGRRLAVYHIWGEI